MHTLTDVPEATAIDERQLALVARHAAVGRLAASFAHELNNPLFGILGLVEFLLRDAEPGTKTHERLTLVQSTGLELKQIVRALLDFARGDADEHRVLPFDEVVAGAVDLVRRASAGKGVEIEVATGEGTLLVDGSPLELKQLVLALLTNAREAMPGGGTIRVRVETDGDEVVAVLADEGPGIAPELLERVFEPFFTTRQEQGAPGLGLTVARGIAERHGGSLTASSEPGTGACLTLRLPRRPGEGA